VTSPNVLFNGRPCDGLPTAPPTAEGGLKADAEGAELRRGVLVAATPIVPLPGVTDRE
jgi:hypothetical protein